MKVKPGFILRKVGKQYVVVATGAASKSFHGMIRLDETGAWAFELLQKGITEQALFSALVERYAANEAQLHTELKAYLDKLKEADVLE